MMATAAEVKRANRRLYDAVGAGYESLDGRRSGVLERWVRERLAELSARAGGDLLLDIGSGSGLVTRAGRGLFRKTIALDLSPGILAACGGHADWRVAADSDALPLADESADVVSCFAVLHHLHDAATLAREVARVLRPGGCFWSDHDMEAAFRRRFRWPLAGYRRLRGADRHYAAAGIDAATYALAEYREDGVETSRFLGQLRDSGLSARADFHWFGLSGLTNRLFGERRLRQGWAPLLRIVASKAPAAVAGHKAHAGRG
jgi:ubiquinone/menaquinone biosynthesis C-methylase UbiE